MRFKTLIILFFLLISVVLADESEDCCEAKSRPDGHAPIGVMGEHRHAEGDWMVSYRFRLMQMDGSLNGSSSVSDQQVLQNYMVTPTKMTMTGNILSMMYAPDDDVTVSFMLPYMTKSMEHLTRRNTGFTTNSSGLGDIKAAALINLWSNEKHKLHFNAGVSLPTGTIDARGSTPMGSNVVLPYPMQLGSGTFDLMPGLTYSGFAKNWSWGAQALGTVRLGENKRGYKLGNVGDFSVWGARRWNDNVSTSLRLNGLTWGDISGQDSRLNPRVIPTADPLLRAGSRLDLLLGLNGDFGNGHRLAVEGGLPIAQSLDGFQLKTNYVLTLGWQYSH
jgi:Putative MetA-pathway of phenol degradation